MFSVVDRGAVDSSFCKVCHNVCDITCVHVWACVKENAVVTVKLAWSLLLMKHTLSEDTS